MKIHTAERLAAILAIGIFAYGVPCGTWVATAAESENSLWLNSFQETSQGNVIMGNPDAPVKLIEYASYTCGHCAAFEATEAPQLEKDKVADGSVSFEMRSLIRDPIDLTLAMLARCGGKDRFFGNHRFLMASQSAILQKTSAITAPTADKLKTRDFSGFMTGIYDDMKLGEWMQQRGISDDQARKCLTNETTINQLLTITAAAGPTYNIQGTPSFIINEKLAAGAHDYNSLKPLLIAPVAVK